MHQPLLPPGPSRRYLCESFLGYQGPCPGGPSECLCLFLPPSHRPSPTSNWVGFPLIPSNDFTTGVFRDYNHSITFWSPRLLASPIVPTAETHHPWAAEAFIRAENASLPPHASDIANHPNTGN